MRIVPARALLCGLAVLTAGALIVSVWPAQTASAPARTAAPSFDVPARVLEKALKADVEAHAAVLAGAEGAAALDWIDLLACLAARYRGDFSRFRDTDLRALCDRLRAGETPETLAADPAQFSRYRALYAAVLGGLAGSFRLGTETEDGTAWENLYGLKAYAPIAAGFAFHHSDDFGRSRSYGHERRHLGHDMIAPVGTPIVCIETGVVTEMGWNQYGGWRLGLRSLDGQRYYYYAHMRRGRPYHADIEKGRLVRAGDVIGYVGQTGYSAQEDANNVGEPHLHWGLQLLSDGAAPKDSQADWVDVYEITKLLCTHRSEVRRDPATKEFYRARPFEEPMSAAAAATAPEGAVKLPVIMYHSILNSTRGSAYIITPAQLEADLAYLQAQNFTTVTVSDLTAFARGEAALPEKPVMLTFDDGHYNNVFYAEPLLAARGMRGVLAVVGAFSDRSVREGAQNPSFSYVTWDDMTSLAARGVFEIENHSYRMHVPSGPRPGCAQRRGESNADYERAIRADLGELQERVFAATGRRPAAFVYPFGLFSGRLENILRDMGFACTMTCTYGVNLLTPGDPDTLFGLKRVLRDGGASVQNILEKYL
ncbi:MAG: polysaccharide deacetylase family protein [Oscillospiraceae bacterium]|jgi:murein DD-endopeptidase MepM/ murein hydrolase activator NlpD|nr:polysaccharide deacetylase family protein [Oscillospiraceae bacterium]